MQWMPQKHKKGLLKSHGKEKEKSYKVISWIPVEERANFRFREVVKKAQRYSRIYLFGST